MSTADTIQVYYETILARTDILPTDPEVVSWANLVDTGVLTLDQAQAAIIASPEAQDLVSPIVQLYQTELGRTPDQAGLASWVNLEENGTSLADIAAAIANSSEGQAFYQSDIVNTPFLTALYQTVLGRAPDTAGFTFWMNSGLTTAQIEYAFATCPEAVARATPAVDNFFATIGTEGTASTAYGGPLYGGDKNLGETFSLTPGVDKIHLSGDNNNVSGTAGFPASNAIPTLTPGDQIIGDAGSTGNQFDLSDLGLYGTWNPTNLPGVVVSNVQTVYMNSNEAVNINTATGLDGYGGLTNLIVNYSDISNNGDFGHNSTITAADSTSVSAEDFATGGKGDTVLGGNDIAFVADGVTTGGAIIIGSTTAAPTGTITATVNDVANNSPASSITTTGGTVVDITQNIAAPALSAVNVANGTSTGGPIFVNGGAATTDVTVVQEAPVLPVTGLSGPPAVTGVSGIADGVVTIIDVNGTSTTKTGTINNVTLTNYAATSSITDNALTHLNLSGSGLGVTIIDNLTPTSPVTPTTLTLTVDGLTGGGAITDANGEITTLNVVAKGKTASKLGTVSDAGLTALIVSGSEAVSMLLATPLLATVTVSDAAGLTTTLGTATAFTSTSTGTDVISIAAATTKTITGNGTAGEELVWNGAAPGSNSSFGSVSGFNVLGIGSGASGTFDLSAITGFAAIDDQGTTSNIVITKANAQPLAIDASSTGTITYSTADTTGAVDTLNVTLGTATTTTGIIVAGLSAEDSQGDGIGTLYVTSNASTPGAFNTITALTDPGLSSLFVTGTAGLTVSTAFATNAASLILGGSETGTAGIAFTGGISDTSLNRLTVNGSDNVTLGGLSTSVAALNLITNGTPVLTVGTLTDGSLTSLTLNGEIAITATTFGTTGNSVTGGADNSNVSITQSGVTASGKTDSITLGNGNDTVSDPNAVAGAIVKITVGNGGTSMSANSIVVGAANATIVAGSGVNNITVGNGNNTISVGNGNDTISVGSGLNTITAGAGTDIFQLLAPGANGQVFSTISGAQANDTLSFIEGNGTPVTGLPSVSAHPGTAITAVGSLAGVATFADYLNAAASASSASAGDMGWFQFTNNGVTNTYIVENVAGTSSFVGGTDYVVGLTGAHNLAGATLAQANTGAASPSGGTDTGTLTLSHFA